MSRDESFDSIQLQFGNREEDWPTLKASDAKQLFLENADFKLKADRKVLFGGNGQISAIGDISFLTGATSPTERMKIFADGNIGIGTGATVPTNKLEVNGKIKATELLVDGIVTGTLAIQRDLNVSGSLILQNVTVNKFSSDGTLNGNSDLTIPTEKAVKTYIDGRVGAIPSSQWSNSGANLIYNVTNSNVGIGTSQPSAKLEVAGNFKLETGVVVNQFSNDTKLGDSDQAVPTQKAVKAYVDGRVGAIPSSQWSNSGANLIYNVTNSNVGIGTSQPGAKLEVAGNFKLQTGVAVNQFSNDTKLGDSDQAVPTQKAVKAYVDTKLTGGTGNSPWETVNNSISYNRGNVGIGTKEPRHTLEIAGDKPGLSLTGKETNDAHLHFANQNTTWGIYAPYINNSLTVWCQRDNKWAGEPYLTIQNDGNVGIGTSTPQAKLQIANGAIMPSAGDSETAGIMFPKDAFTGSGDAAWIRYYARTGEATTFEIGTSNDVNDHIALMASGYVGIFTKNPRADLHVFSSLKQATLRIQAAPTKSGVTEFGSGSIEFWSDPQGSDVEWRPGFIQSTDEGGFIGGLAFFANVPGKRQDAVEVMRISKGKIYGKEFASYSSRELKENITDFSTQEAIEALANLNPVKFNYREDNQKQLKAGFIAEDVPELVATADRKAICALDIVAVLTKVIKQQQEELSCLKERLNALEAAAS